MAAIPLAWLCPWACASPPSLLTVSACCCCWLATSFAGVFFLAATDWRTFGEGVPLEKWRSSPRSSACDREPAKRKYEFRGHETIAFNELWGLVYPHSSNFRNFVCVCVCVCVRSVLAQTWRSVADGDCLRLSRLARALHAVVVGVEFLLIGESPIAAAWKEMFIN